MLASYEINLREVTFSLSNALDLVGVDDVRHGKRVTFMAAAFARGLDWPEETSDKLIHAAMLHDCGVSSSIMHTRLVNELHWPGENEHCLKGHAMLSSCPPLSNLATAIKYHHTHWDLLADQDLAAEEAEISNCIFLADRVDALMANTDRRDAAASRRLVTERIAKLSGTYFNPEFVDTFVDVSKTDAFWFTLTDDRLNDYLRGWLNRGMDDSLGIDEIRSIAGLFADIVDAKSPYTAMHSRGVASLSRHIGKALGIDDHQCDKLEIAGLLHDLGKLRVPDEILEKPGPLDEEERLVMARHSYDTYLILAAITGLEEIARWAAQHHERPSGSGYPFHSSGNELALEARILAVADVFQALAQRRPYREPLPSSKILSILTDMAGRNHLDAEVVAYVGKDLDDCYQACLP